MSVCDEMIREENRGGFLFRSISVYGLVLVAAVTCDHSLSGPELRGPSGIHSRLVNYVEREERPTIDGLIEILHGVPQRKVVLNFGGRVPIGDGWLLHTDRHDAWVLQGEETIALPMGEANVYSIRGAYVASEFSEDARFFFVTIGDEAVAIKNDESDPYFFVVK